MKFSKEYQKLSYPIFTTIRQNGGYYQEGQRINIDTPEQTFRAEIVGIRYLSIRDITPTMALRDADCSVDEIIKLFKMFYKDKANDLILITLMKMQ